MVHVGTFEPATALPQVAEERCTIGFPAFDTIWMQVLDHADFPALLWRTVLRRGGGGDHTWRRVPRRCHGLEGRRSRLGGPAGGAGRTQGRGHRLPAHL